MEFSKWRVGTSELQKVPKFLETSKRNFLGIVFPLDKRQMMMKNMVSLRATKVFGDLLHEVLIENVDFKLKLTYGKIGWTVALLFVYGKLTDVLYERIARFVNIDTPWKLFIMKLKDHLVSRLEQLSLAFQLKEALQHTFYANWREEADYMSPHCFVYLVERLLLLVSSSQKNFYTTKSSLIETLYFEKWHEMSSRSMENKNPVLMEECHSFVVHIIDQLLFNSKETFEWLEQSKINAELYNPLLVLRLIILLSLICLNTGQYFGFLETLLGRNDIKAQLPPAFHEILLLGSKDNFGNVLAEALKIIEDPLIIVRLENEFPGFVCSEALVIDLNVIRHREEILEVLFPIKAVQVQEDTFGLETRRLSTPSPSPSPCDTDVIGKEDQVMGNENKRENLDLTKTYQAFWIVVDSLSSRTRGNSMGDTGDDPHIKLEIESCIHILDVATTKYNQEASWDNDGTLFVEAKNILDELKQLSVSSSVSSKDHKSNTQRIGEVFNNLQVSRPRLQKWLDSVFLESSQTAKCNVKLAAKHVSNKGKEKHEVKGNPPSKKKNSRRRSKK
ncbi:hypothetical protein IFM89_005600 [Coptis chinensis]|uniref:Uncharacterized protein n=1 Tax=Coptis chinensis TaxID=261450 RepID=A0A835M735_9MAGN|nr:hypothetical protein IFM89_005600 [Coptis chinensis]